MNAAHPCSYSTIRSTAVTDNLQRDAFVYVDMQGPAPGQEPIAMAGRVFSGDGLTLEAVRVAPGFRLTRHEHDQPHVCAVVDGAFDESERRGRRRCPSGTVRVSPAGDRHSIEFGASGAHCLIVTIDAECLSENRSMFRERTFWQDAWLSAVAARAYRAVAAGDRAKTLTIECIAWELIAQIQRHGRSRAVTPPPIWLRRVRDRLHDTFDAAVSMRLLADEAGVSREHLARAFRVHYGVSAEDFQRGARIDAACQRLLTTDAPLSSIATECGFADQSHFTRWCVRAKGMSPAAIRRGATADVTCVQDFSVELTHTGRRHVHGGRR